MAKFHDASVPNTVRTDLCFRILVRCDLGRWNVILALTIAFSKGTLATLFFMHARYSPRRTQLVVVAGILWLGIMILLTMSDYLTRLSLAS